jgi:hypothetical protein
MSRSRLLRRIRPIPFTAKLLKLAVYPEHDCEVSDCGAVGTAAVLTEQSPEINLDVSKPAVLWPAIVDTD